MTSKHIKTSTVKYYVDDGRVYFGTKSTSCDIDNQDMEINFGDVPPGTNTLEKTLSMTISCSFPVTVRVSIQGDAYANQYAIKRGELADLYLAVYCSGETNSRDYTCDKSIAGNLNTTLYGVVDTKNRAGAFENYFVVTLSIL